MRYWSLLLPILLIFLAACQSQPTSLPTPFSGESRYFPETGQTVQDDFLRFFDSYGGVENFGLPLTGEMVVDGWQVQYFEKTRLEYHPENEPAYRVTAGWLGELLRRRQPPISTSHIPPAKDPHRRYYPQTGHTLSGDFLTYFDSYGGKVRFGYPISEPFLQEGRVAQDFQSARFFWTPETDPPVTLEDTGWIHLESMDLR